MGASGEGRLGKIDPKSEVYKMVGYGNGRNESLPCVESQNDRSEQHQEV